MPTRRRTSEDDPQPSAATGAPGGDGDDWDPDATPLVDGYEQAPDAVAPLVGAGVPAVVAVVVTRNPGPWLEATLEGLDRQEYANLATLVVDAGSLVDLTERVARTLPGAFVKRLAEPSSFAAAAAAAVESVEGASFLLFLHDDVDLRAGSVQALVEEAFRSNAGIVGAKLVDWDDPQRLRSVGAAVDRFGFAWPLAEPGEMDQAQHDAVREVFVVQSAAMLVRADLFADLGGFSELDGAGEELDLCWRARVAGARTAVTPAAVARHRERSELGDPTGRSAAAVLRHQFRTMVVCSGPVQLLRTLPQALLFGLLDVLYAVVRGRFAQAGASVGAFAWNVAHLPGTLAAHRRVARSRRTPDAEIRRLQIRGSARITRFLRAHRGAGLHGLGGSLVSAARDRGVARSEDAAMWAAALGTALVAVLWIGSRGLLSGGVPEIREFVALGAPADLWREWWSGWRSTGVGASGAAPSALALGAVLQWVAVGARGLVRTLLVIGPVAVGAVTAWRMFRGALSLPARAVAAVLYVANPLPFNALAEGRWQALVAYAAAPAILGRLARAGGWEPFAAEAGRAGSLQRQAVGLGAIVALAAAVAPGVVAVTVALSVLVAAVMLATGDRGDAGRAVAVAGGAVVVAAVVHLPWTIAVVSSPWRWARLVGSTSDSASAPLARALHFHTGPFGGPASVGLLVVAAVGLLVARHHRFRWAVVGATLIVASAALVVGFGRSDGAAPPVELLLVPAALGVSVAAAAGVEAFRSDVVGGTFGVRQLGSVLAGLAAVVAVLAAVPALGSGRWQLPRGDVAAALETVRAPSGEYRTLWIGDPDALPGRGSPLAAGMSFLLTDGAGPTLATTQPADPTEGERRLAALLADARAGGSVRLGGELGRYGVRLVVLAERVAPLPFDTRGLVVDPVLGRALAEQVDLVRVEVAPGLTVYENLAARPVRYRVPTAQREVAGAAPIDATDAETAVDIRPALGSARRPTAASGPLADGDTLVVAGTRHPGWSLTVDGVDAAAEPFAGWSAAFAAPAAGRAELRYATPVSGVLLHIVQLAALAALPWLHRRRVGERRVRSTRPLGIGEPPDPDDDGEDRP